MLRRKNRDLVTIEIYAAEGGDKELSAMYQAAARGLMKTVTNGFAHITGHEPMDMEEFLIKNTKLLNRF